MRRISFALTTDQILNQSKFVTRRMGWWSLVPGDLLQPIYKGMGLKKGEKQQLLGCPIEVVEAYAESLDAITQLDVILEGFPTWTPEQFVEFFCKKTAARRQFNPIASPSNIVMTWSRRLGRENPVQQLPLPVRSSLPRAAPRTRQRNCYSAAP